MESSRKPRRFGRVVSISPAGVPESGRAGAGELAQRSVRELVQTVTGPIALRSADWDDVARLARMRAGDLVREYGLGARGADRLAAAFELGRRLGRGPEPGPRVASARAVHDLLADELAGLDQEAFVAVLVDGKHQLRRYEVVSLGTLTSSLVHPREVFRLAIRHAAAAVVVAHNHPSGDPEPSAEDVAVTRRLIRAGHLLGIPLLDHVVLGAGRWVSLRERISFDEVD